MAPVAAKKPATNGKPPKAVSFRHVPHPKNPAEYELSIHIQSAQDLMKLRAHKKGALPPQSDTKVWCSVGIVGDEREFTSAIAPSAEQTWVWDTHIVFPVFSLSESVSIKLYNNQEKELYGLLCKVEVPVREFIGARKVRAEKIAGLATFTFSAICTSLELRLQALNTEPEMLLSPTAPSARAAAGGEAAGGVAPAAAAAPSSPSLGPSPSPTPLLQRALTPTKGAAAAAAAGGEAATEAEQDQPGVIALEDDEEGVGMSINIKFFDEVELHGSSHARERAATGSAANGKAVPGKRRPDNIKSALKGWLDRKSGSSPEPREAGAEEAAPKKQGLFSTFIKPLKPRNGGASAGDAANRANGLAPNPLSVERVVSEQKAGRQSRFGASRSKRRRKASSDTDLLKHSAALVEQHQQQQQQQQKQQQQHGAEAAKRAHSLSPPGPVASAGGSSPDLSELLLSPTPKRPRSPRRRRRSFGKNEMQNLRPSNARLLPAVVHEDHQLGDGVVNQQEMPKSPSGASRSKSPSVGARSRSPGEQRRADPRVTSPKKRGSDNSLSHGRGGGGRSRSESDGGRSRSESDGGRSRSDSDGGRARSNSGGGGGRSRSDSDNSLSRGRGGRHRGDSDEAPPKSPSRRSRRDEPADDAAPKSGKPSREKRRKHRTSSKERDEPPAVVVWGQD